MIADRSPTTALCCPRRNASMPGGRVAPSPMAIPPSPSCRIGLPLGDSVSCVAIFIMLAVDVTACYAPARDLCLWGWHHQAAVGTPGEVEKAAADAATLTSGPGLRPMVLAHDCLPVEPQLCCRRFPRALALTRHSRNISCTEAKLSPNKKLAGMKGCEHANNSIRLWCRPEGGESRGTISPVRDRLRNDRHLKALAGGGDGLGRHARLRSLPVCKRTLSRPSTTPGICGEFATLRADTSLYIRGIESGKNRRQRRKPSV